MPQATPKHSITIGSAVTIRNSFYKGAWTITEIYNARTPNGSMIFKCSQPTDVHGGVVSTIVSEEDLA